MNARDTLKYFQQRQAAIIELIREIVNIESPSHDAARSKTIVDWVETQFRSAVAGISAERITSSDGEHIVIRAFPGEGRHTLLLGHTDTVHPAGTNLQNPTRIDGDKFYGCGIFDMKSGIILMLEALRFLAASGIEPARPIVIVLSCDEEIGSPAGRDIVEREAKNAECCFVIEPSLDGMVKTGRKGTGTFRVKARGVPAHAGLEPEKGANAIVELAGHIKEINALANVTAGTTVNVTTFDGGTTTNVIPEYAECAVDVRFSSMAEAERVNAAFRSLEPMNRRVVLEIADGINRPPMERTEAVVGLFEKARRLAADFDYELAETQVGGASDGNFVATLGVPVLDGLGITGAGAHRLDEHILVSDIANRATLLLQLLC